MRSARNKLFPKRGLRSKQLGSGFEYGVPQPRQRFCGCRNTRFRRGAQPRFVFLFRAFQRRDKLSARFARVVQFPQFFNAFLRFRGGCRFAAFPDFAHIIYRRVIIGHRFFAFENRLRGSFQQLRGYEKLPARGSVQNRFPHRFPRRVFKRHRSVSTHGFQQKTCRARIEPQPGFPYLRVHLHADARFTAHLPARESGQRINRAVFLVRQLFHHAE